MEAALKYPNVKKSKIKIPECEKKNNCDSKNYERLFVQI